MTDGPFKLAASDVASPTWAKLERHLRARLADLRARNDNPQTADETAFLRGRIAEVKALLHTAEEDPPPIDVA